jgi:hypothetical protein
MTRRDVCFFPGRESTYVRTKTIHHALKEAGFSVDDCAHGRRTAFRYAMSFFSFLKFFRRCDVIVVGFCGQLLIFVVRLFTRKPVVLDAYISVYQTLVF